MITECLFHGAGLRLKWGGTHLTVHGTVSDLLMKVDLRILHDRIRQHHNVETDVGVMEAANEQSGDAKYIGDRYKILIESKAVIDRFVLDGCLIDIVDSLQICGLEVYFGNITFAEPGFYIGTQFYHATINNSLSNITKYLGLTFHLLCFRNQCVSVTNKYENHLTTARLKRSSAKRIISELPKYDLIIKQESICGSWNLPRTSKTPPPPQPKKLVW